MKQLFSDNAWEEYLFGQKTDKEMVKRISQLIRDIEQNRNNGIGKPEPLRFNLTGWWSRRIDEEHRLIYKVEDECIHLAQLRYHY